MGIPLSAALGRLALYPQINVPHRLNPLSHCFASGLGESDFCLLVFPSHFNPALMHKPTECHFSRRDGKATNHPPIC